MLCSFFQNDHETNQEGKCFQKANEQFSFLLVIIDEF